MTAVAKAAKAAKIPASMIRVLSTRNEEADSVTRSNAKLLLTSGAAEVVQLEPLIIRLKQELVPMIRLSKDVRAAAVTMDAQEARYLVDTYYQMQDNRIRAAGQVRSMAGEPHTTLAFFEGQAMALEDQLKKTLDDYSMSTEVGRWSRSVCGIGPVIAAGLMAHIDIRKAETAGQIWRFAGLDPTVEWKKADEVKIWIKANLKNAADLNNEFVYITAEKWGRNPHTLLRMATTDHLTGEPKELTIDGLAKSVARRPYNADLKRLCWLMGESFVKVKGNENDVYGKLYEQRKAYEQNKNLEGGYEETAAQILLTKNYRGDTKAKKYYESGLLPDGHIHSRAKRWAVKIFLSHWHEIAYKAHFKKDPPAPFAIAILGHAHRIDPQQ